VPKIPTRATLVKCFGSNRTRAAKLSFNQLFAGEAQELSLLQPARPPARKRSGFTNGLEATRTVAAKLSFNQLFAGTRKNSAFMTAAFPPGKPPQKRVFQNSI
jgi:hypothetical protein